MITRDDVMPLLLEACPSFRDKWEEEVKDHYVHVNDDGTRLHYIDAMEFTLHVVRQVKEGNFAELPALFEVLERLHTEGDDYVRELATIGYVEGLQDNEGLDHSVFEPFLGPETRRWWLGVEAYWRGKNPGPGVQPMEG